MQGLEGDLDSSHVYFIHGRLKEDAPAAPGQLRGVWTNDRAPKLDIVPTPYGVYYTALRHINDQGDIHHRVNQYLYPFFSMITIDSTVNLRAWVPIDDDYHMLFMMSGKADESKSSDLEAFLVDSFKSAGGYIPETPDPRTRYMSFANKSNDYLLDYEVQKKYMMSGVPFLVNLQDRAMTETMGAIYDRRREHLGTSDRMIIQVRKQLLAGARWAHGGRHRAGKRRRPQPGTRPPGRRHPEREHRLEGSHQDRPQRRRRRAGGVRPVL